MDYTVYSPNGERLGYYVGDNDIGKVYDKDGNLVGEYWGHEIFGKDGMSRGYHNGDPKETAVKLLIFG